MNKTKKSIPKSIPTSQYFECIECLYSVVKDILPQIGNIILQDYEKLNRGLILTRKILGK